MANTWTRSSEVAAVAASYRFGMPDQTQRGVLGERMGRGTGSSLEFQDRRAYVAGDDVRHLDWKAFARTDQLMVRLYREEILPQIDLLIDTSRSIAVENEKAQLVTDMAWLLAVVGRSSGMHVRLICCQEEPRVIEMLQFEREGLQFEGRLDLAQSLHGCSQLLRTSSIRILLSDFLSPVGPEEIVRPLAARASGLELIQVLGASDAEPSAGQALRLTDAETDSTLDLVLDAHTIAAYKERLQRVTAGFETECRRNAGRLHVLSLPATIAALCRDDLSRSGLLTPA